MTTGYDMSNAGISCLEKHETARGPTPRQPFTKDGLQGKGTESALYGSWNEYIRILYIHPVSIQKIPSGKLT